MTGPSIAKSPARLSRALGIALAVAALSFNVGALAAPVTIDFEGEDIGPPVQPYVLNGVTLRTLPEGGLTIADPAAPNSVSIPVIHPSTRSLVALFRDRSGAVIIEMDQPVSSLSMQVGLDFPVDIPDIDLIPVPVASATAALLVPLTQLGDAIDPGGVTVLALNRNYLIDQTIAYAGPLRQTFALFFGDPAGPDVPADETILGYVPARTSVLAIDNIMFDIEAVPAPATLPLLAISLLGAATLRRRRD